MEVSFRPSQIAGLASAVGALAADQATKAVINANSAALAGGVSLLPGFNLVYLRNDGVTFGLLAGVPWWALATLALGIIVWLAVLMAQAGNRLEALAYGLVIGGALGNVVDRLRFGGVTDFLDFYVRGWHWPAFNFSDIAVVSGVLLLLLQQARVARRQKHSR